MDADGDGEDGDEEEDAGEGEDADEMEEAGLSTASHARSSTACGSNTALA